VLVLERAAAAAAPPRWQRDISIWAGAPPFRAGNRHADQPEEMYKYLVRGVAEPELDKILAYCDAASSISTG